MNANSSFGKGSEFLRCLFQFCLNQQIPIQTIHTIKPSVWLIRTEYFPMIVKQFCSEAQLQRQKQFLQQLRQAGFQRSYTFIDNLPILHVGKNCYGFLQYISPHNSTFQFDSVAACQEGLQLLTQFHTHAKGLTEQFVDKVPHLHLPKRWAERLSEFQSHLPLLQQWLDERLLLELLEMGHCTLEQFRLSEAPELPIITHGDLAHHNFLRSSTGQLYLIDFDLMTYAPPIVDVLQYSNRILPFHHSSLTALAHHPEIRRYLHVPYFLQGLAFPTDIFREWNRLLRQPKEKSPRHLEAILHFTKKQFLERVQLFKTVQGMLK